MRIRIASVLVLLLALVPASPAGAVAGFTDVSSNDYFAAPVAWMVDEGITDGTGPSTFSPDQNVTRAMTLAFMWRMKGEPAVSGGHPFTDLDRSWQHDPVAWGFTKGITTGVLPTKFAPYRSITRGEFAVLLWRLAGEPGVSGSSPFVDVTEDWQRDAVAWMHKKGITTGTSPNRFSPDAPVSRGQAATFLWRYSGSPAVEVAPDDPVVTTGCGGSGTSKLPSTAGRNVVDASGFTGNVVLDQPNTIYDFKNVSAGRDITIAASNVEARNIRGSGARRIGQRDGRDYVDSGFKNFEFTYIATENGDGGDIIRPYFYNGTDVNPDGRIGSGSPGHIYAYEGDVVEPLLHNVTIRGWKKDPAASDPHNDGVHFTGISGGRVFSPTIRDSDMKSGAAFAVLARHTYGRFTIENSTFVARYGAYYAVMGDARDVSPTVEILWRNNTLVNGSDAIFVSGYDLVSGSCGLRDVTVE